MTNSSSTAYSQPLEQLDSYLSNKYQDDSVKNLTTLLSEFEGDFKKFVSFTGAGVSKPLGIEDWTDLLRSLLSFCTEGGETLDIWQNDEPRCSYNRFMEQDNFNKDYYPALAEAIFKDYQNQDKEKSFNEIINKKMRAKYTASTSSLIKLILSIDTHITTNYDQSISNAYDFLEYLKNDIKSFENIEQLNAIYNTAKNIKYYHKVDDPPIENKINIYYLHYYENDKEHQYILRESDYERFYPTRHNPTPPIYHGIRYFYKNTKIIFIGFSFADFYVNELFRKIASDYENSKILFREKDEEEKTQPKEFHEISHYLLIDEHAAQTYINNYKSKLFKQYGLPPQKRTGS